MTNFAKNITKKSCPQTKIELCCKNLKVFRLICDLCHRKDQY